MRRIQGEMGTQPTEKDLEPHYGFQTKEGKSSTGNRWLRHRTKPPSAASITSICSCSPTPVPACCFQMQALAARTGSTLGVVTTHGLGFELWVLFMSRGKPGQIFYHFHLVGACRPPLQDQILSDPVISHGGWQCVHVGEDDIQKLGRAENPTSG